jgi:hypothetical protein
LSSRGCDGASSAGLLARTVRSRRLFASACASVFLLTAAATAPPASNASRLTWRKHLTIVRLQDGRLLHRHTTRRHSRRAKVTIVGGVATSVEQAPWQVLILVSLSQGRGLLCGGSIVTAGEVLTAAHCAIDPLTGIQVPASAIQVVAGISNYETEAGEQEAQVSEVRVHPYYLEGSESSDPDDVATLRLKAPLTPSARVQSIALTPQVQPAEGAAVRLTGFGRQSAEQQPSGQLYSLGMTLASSGQCGGEADAVMLCASTPGGSACSGDSGGGLTFPGGSLLAVVDTVQVSAGRNCAAGALAGFASLTAPEIRSFVEGDDTPPRAPRGGGATIAGTAAVGQSLGCLPGSWSGSPSFTFAFVDSSGGPVLQSGPSSTYSLLQSDVGRTIFCEVRAANAGGTGISRTSSSSRVLPAPPSEVLAPVPSASAPAPKPKAAAQVRLLNSTIGVQANGTAWVKIACTGTSGCRGKLTLTVRISMRRGVRSISRILRLGAAHFAIAAGHTGIVKVVLSANARARLATAHGRLAARLTIAVLQPAPRHTNTRTVRLVTRSAGRPRTRL